MKIEKPREISLPAGVLGFAATADRQRLYAACMDGQIFEVDAASGEKQAFSARHGSFASGCALLPDGKTLITSGFDGALIWHDTATRSEIRRVKAHDFWSWKLALSPDGVHVASVTGQYLVGGEKYEPAPSAEPTVKVFDAHTGELVHAWEFLAPALSVAISPDSRLVAAANLMGDVQIWDLTTGQSVAKFNSPDFTCWGIIKSPHYCGGIYALAFAPDGASLLCAGMGEMKDPMAGNGKMTWQRWSWKEQPAKMLGQIHDGEHGSGLMEALAHTPDGAAFLMAGRQAQGTWNAALFSAGEGKLLASLDTKSRVTQALFSEDGKTLFLAAATGQPKREGGKWPDYGRIYVSTVTSVVA